MTHKCFSLWLALTLLSFTYNAQGVEPIPDESGLSGFVRLGGGVMNYSNNTIAGNSLMDVGTDTIFNLDETPDSETTGIGVFNFELGWTFAPQRTQIVLGSNIEDVARLDFSQQLAVKKEFADKSLVSVGILFTGFPTEVYEDPFLTGSPRRETDRTSYGARIAYDSFLDSNFEVRYSLRNIDIDDERSGDSLDLTPQERSLLQRDGLRHVFDLSYRYRYDGKNLFVPTISFFYSDRDGDAITHWGTDFQLTYIFKDDPFTAVINGLIGFADYDETNPVFSKSQDDDRYGISGQFYYRQPFGLTPFGNQDFSLFCNLSYFLVESNIDFYETEVILATAGVMFQF
ncbi:MULTISPECIES: DUF2860 family protein [Desulfosediminicola]|uniref:DUF2860 family protein n=1 Tax=Desulfosediminicola TaxID=2886823 RepID=UPI0010AD8347|nr:DUF2860 family protein [Desulfosediminicola ganghwensis]